MLIFGSMFTTGAAGLPTGAGCGRKRYTATPRIRITKKPNASANSATRLPMISCVEVGLNPGSLTGGSGTGVEVGGVVGPGIAESTGLMGCVLGYMVLGNT
jgi:hypothetical protein